MTGAPAATSAAPVDELGEAVADDPGVLGGAELAVAGVDDEVGAVGVGGRDLRRGAEGGAAAAGEARLGEQGDDGS